MTNKAKTLTIERIPLRKKMQSLKISLTLATLCVLLINCKPESGDASDQAEKEEISMKDQIFHARKLRSLIMSDPHRPTWHFVSPEGRGYPFDPQAAIYWNGKYHLGFVYQTRQNGKLEHVWGHIVSTNLFHWTLYPDMLDVKEGDLEEGIFAGGSFLSREGIPHIVYHGLGSNTNLIAYSTDEDLRDWKKYDGSVGLKTPQEGHPDHGKYVAWDADGWYDEKTDYYYQISGGHPQTLGVAGFFKSKDLKDWEYLGDLIDQGDRRRLDFEDLSCPDFFPLGNKYMLLFISHNLGSQYYLGEFENDKFTVEKYARMNWPGGTFFAPEQLVDDRGRNIIWGWVLQRKQEDMLHEKMSWEDKMKTTPEYGWSGIMSMPRVVSLSQEGEVQINPPEEVEALRLSGITESNLSLEPNSEIVLDARGTSLEIEVEMVGRSSPFGVKVFSSPDGSEETLIKYEPESKELVIDFARSAVSGKGQVTVLPNCMLEAQMEGFTENVSEQRAPFELKKGESLKLNIFIDRSIIEVFANGRQCVTQVVYPELSDSDGVKLFSGGDLVQVLSAKVWKMATTNAY